MKIKMVQAKLSSFAKDAVPKQGRTL